MEKQFQPYEKQENKFGVQRSDGEKGEVNTLEKVVNGETTA